MSAKGGLKEVDLLKMDAIVKVFNHMFEVPAEDIADIPNGFVVYFAQMNRNQILRPLMVEAFNKGLTVQQVQIRFRVDRGSANYVQKLAIARRNAS